MHVSHYIATTSYEGALNDVVNVKPLDVPTLEQVLTSLSKLAFIAETVAHLQGKERELLPTAEEARRLIAALQPKEL